MPSKSRWALNPKKWFGHKSHAGQKREPTTIERIPPPPPTATTSTRTITTTTSTNLSDKSKTCVVPISFLNMKASRPNITANHFQLPAFRLQQQRNTSTFVRSNTFQHTEPTIRKTNRIEENLAFDITRLNISKIQTKIPEDFEQDDQNKSFETSLLDMSHRCLIDYPRETSTRVHPQDSLPSRSSPSLSPSSSSSSLRDDENNSSSSSGVFTDERQRTDSKDTLSNLEVLSIESIADSQTSLNQVPTRPIIHHYRRPVSVFESIDDKSQQRQTPFDQSQRSQSAQGTLKDTRTISSSSKSRQSSASIMKKIDKRSTTSRSPSAALVKSGLVRVANDTYRLTANTIDHFSFETHHNSQHSFTPYYDHDDVLRSANDEESYAALPRTTSTEQLHNNQNDLRTIVDECIRPLMTSSIGKTNRPVKANNRFRRQQTQLNIENLSERLLASVDYRMYTRYQRCN